MVTVGVYVREDAAALEETLAALSRASPEVRIVLLPDVQDAALARSLASRGEFEQRAGDARGPAAAFNRLLEVNASGVLVFLESGSIVTHGWLDALVAALGADPSPGLAGPSTNLAWNSQRLRRAPGCTAALETIDTFARDLARRAGGRPSPAVPKHSLADFCLAVSRHAADAIGVADEAFGEGPCWEMEYNARAAAAGFSGVWVQASYVHRRPIGMRRRRAETQAFADARARYQRRVQSLSPATRPVARSVVPKLSAPPPPQARMLALAAEPLVSCIMPTRDRRPFVGRAVRQFLAQDYPHRELIVVDDGVDAVDDLLGSDSRIRVVRPSQRMTIGAKRNLACEAARGDLIVHWDDDDWMADRRLRYQVHALLASGADACGLARLYFHDPTSGRAWEYVYPDAAPRWLAGGTLCYRKALWRAHPFANLNEGEDTRFIWNLRGARLLALDDPTFYVATIHAGNTSRKRTTDRRYRPCDAGALDAIMRPAAPLVSCIMPTRDRRRFVRLAIHYFLRQDYAARELIIVDDGCDAVEDLVPDDQRIRYVRVNRGSIGAKRNAALREARGGCVAHWDDDDWYAPGRLTAQVAPIASGAADVVALSMRHVLTLPALEFWRCEPALHARLHHRDLCCGTIVYRRELWERHGPYPALNVAEDVRFLQRASGAGARITRLDADDLFVCVRHPTNTWRIARDWNGRGRGWTRIVPPAGISAADLDSYRELAVTPAALAHAAAVQSGVSV